MGEKEAKIIPICFAMDEGYIMPTTVALYSILNNLGKNIKIHLFLLVPDKFDHDKNIKMEQLAQSAQVYLLEYIYISDERFYNKSKIDHITYVTFFRLIMASKIPYDKCIYLDGDIIVKDDIASLYAIDIKKNYIAGVATPYSQLRKRDRKQAMDRLGIDSYSLYVNAGVLIFNLSQIRKNNMEEVFISLLDKNFPVQDQDILNSACYPYIMKIPCKFNVVEEMMRYPLRELRKIYTDKDILEARRYPVIFHFANAYKPWRYYGLSFAGDWMNYYTKIYGYEIKRKNYVLAYWKDRVKHYMEMMAQWLPVRK